MCVEVKRFWTGVVANNGTHISCPIHFCLGVWGKGMKDTAAEATDALQPWGLLCNPVMKIIKFFRVVEHRWSELTSGKPKCSERNLCQCHFVNNKSHMDWPGIEPRTSAVKGRRLTAWAMARPCPIQLELTRWFSVWIVLCLHFPTCYIYLLDNDLMTLSNYLFSTMF
jgi:hypothetical protein